VKNVEIRFIIQASINNSSKPLNKELRAFTMMPPVKPSYFDDAAATWDEKPDRIALAKSVGEAVLHAVSPTKSMDVLDYGCGTGLLGLFLLPHVKSVTGADASTGMLDVLQKKIDNNGLANMKTIRLDLENDSVPAGQYHLIVSNMTMHHIADTEKVVEAFYTMLHPHGILCIADLDSEPGIFHAPEVADSVHHHGFNRMELESLVGRIGFTNSKTLTAHVLRKPIENGTERDFSIFLLVGDKGNR
jgi:2-polyprenyl-3-methyl-5-hydroxy-6-metoxy-1,4-benzoquinol methylase